MVYSPLPHPNSTTIGLSFLKNVSLTAVVADAVGIGLVTTLIWKVYHEYWKSDDDKKSR